MTCILGLEQKKRKGNIQNSQARERKIRSLSHISCIKNKDVRLLTQDKEIMNRCIEYLSKLLNEHM